VGLVLRRPGGVAGARGGRAVPPRLSCSPRGPAIPEHDPRSIAFPKLGDDRIAALGRCSFTAQKPYRDGEALFRAGERDGKFFVVITGKVEIVDETGDAPRTVVVHEPGEFAGDVSQITGRPAVVSGYARGETKVYEVSQAALREILNHHPDLADIILQAFITRRQLLRGSGNFTGLRVIGSHSSPETFRVRDFLARNNILFTWLDTEADPQVADLLRRFWLSDADTPAVMCGRSRCSASRRTASWRTPSACGGSWSRRCTTWSWSGPGRPGWRRPCTGRARG
jgi:thioredoxin reductase (NADPH)